MTNPVTAGTETTVLYSTHGAVALVTLNRPQALNSFTRQMHRDLGAALDRAELAGAFVQVLTCLSLTLRPDPTW